MSEKLRKRMIRTAAVIGAVAVLVLALSVWTLFDQNRLTVSTHTVVSDKLTAPVRVALLADLHNAEFGEQNAELIAAVADSKPDLIVMAGDMCTYTLRDVSVVTALIERLVPLAPVYFGIGNHEEFLIGKDVPVVESVTAAGATVLNEAAELLVVNGQRVLIGGLESFPEMFSAAQGFLKDFTASPDFKLLICHYPEYITTLRDYALDAVMMGHAHGGQVILPGIGGLYAPEQKWFPRYYAGVYHENNTDFIISRGLGNPVAVPRINNPPELVIVDFVPNT